MRRAAVIGLAWLSSSTALAQTSASTTDQPAAPAADIVVTGQTPAARSTIDRKVYSTTRDLQSSTGSVSDVLRNLPSVDVDAQGNVSLRGDTNVQILIDGRPSTLVSGTNRAEALQQLPADSIESVEVITNPSAQFRPDGSSGLINIITKKNRKPGYSGTVQGSAGTDGRLNAGVSGAYNRGALSLAGSFNARRDAIKRPFSNERSQLDAASGKFISSNQDSVTRAKLLSKIVKLNADYDLSPRDRLGGSFSYNSRDQSPDIVERNLIFDAAGGIASDYTRIGSGDESEPTTEASAKYRHSFATKGKEFTLDLRRSRTTEDRLRRYVTRYAIPALADTIEQLRPTRSEVQREATAELALPLGKSKLLLGYDLIRDDADNDNVGSRTDPLTGALVPNPAFTNRFVFDRTIHALYATFNGTVVPKVTANIGLRLEQVYGNTNQVTTAQKDHTSYFKAYPTLHLQYDLSDASNIRLSYSHRVARPEAEELNPYPVFSDPLNLRAGNPFLKPQQTHSYEVGYSYDASGRSLEATLFLRQTYDAFTEVRRALSPTVILTTRDNLGRSTAAGLDLSARGKLSAALTVNLSGTAFYNKIDAGNLGVTGARSGFSYTAKGSVDLQLSAKDLIQLSANQAGKRLTAQGYRLANGFANIGYRRQLSTALTAVLTVSDVFNSQRERSTIDTPTFHDITSRRRSRRAASLALTWRFGGTTKSAAPTRFEFDN